MRITSCVASIALISHVLQIITLSLSGSDIQECLCLDGKCPELNDERPISWAGECQYLVATRCYSGLIYSLITTCVVPVVGDIWYLVERTRNNCIEEMHTIDEIFISHAIIFILLFFCLLFEWTCKEN